MFSQDFHNAVFPSWVTTYHENNENQEIPFLLIFSSFALAFVGLFVVLFGINCYHRYVGYNQVQKTIEHGVENTDQLVRFSTV